jgi:Transposase DDE domain
LSVVPDKYKYELTNFTRNRKLPFAHLVSFMFKALRKKIGLEINIFYEKLVTMALEDEQSSLTASAFCQSRQKLKPIFFRDGLRHFVNEYYTDNEQTVQLWQGKRLLSVDGSIIELPQTEALEKEYGTFCNHQQKRVSARVSILYDVLNEMIIDGILGKISVGERSMACLHLAQASNNDLILYDRGYPSFDFIFEHQQKEIDFVMRVRVGWSNVVKSFVASGLASQEVEIMVGKNESVKDKAYDHQTKIKVRLIRVVLLTGEVEVLMSSLLDEKLYPSSLFSTLYFYRWGIETRYDVLKNALRIENFSGLSELVIEQDFFITLLIANMEALLRDEVNQQLKVCFKERQYEYKVNISACVSLLRDKITELLLGQQPQEVLEYLKKVFSQHIEAVRPNRSFERKMKQYRTKNKPKMMKNRKVNN